MKKKMFRVSAACLSLMLAAGTLSAMPSVSVLAAGNVVVNEICTKNTKLAAPDGQFYDYIELYNTGSSAASVGGYALSDDASQPRLYVIPDGTVIPANGYLTVYCGVKSGSGVAGAGFGLSKDGETVIFSDAGGNVVESIELPPMEDDTAYARVPDGSSQFAVVSELSAGRANPSNATQKLVVSAPQFSKGSGFYDSGFDLTITADQGCTVYYTTDGSDPDTSSERASGSIRIYDKSSEPDVYAAITDIADGYKAPSEPVRKAAIIRAVAVDAQGNKSNVVTNTYFIGYSSNDIEKKMRVISLVTDPDNLFDYDTGIYVKGKIYATSQGNMMESWSHPANYTQDGKEWERPAQITVFEQGQATYNAGVGIRMHGAATRSASQKSFNLYARTEYGTPKLKYDFFNGKLTNHKGEIIDSFDKITLRNGGNDDKTKIRDRLNQEMVPDKDFGTQAQTECVVFIDGEFWGTYNIVEKLGKEYISDHYKVKEESVCMIKTDELSDGSEQGWADYEALKSLANSANYTDSATYDKFRELLDLDSFAQYMATEIMLGNSDFGDNNYALWKTETIDESKKYADGQWRFILFDTEYGQGLYGQSNANSSIIDTLRRKNCWISKLFFGLLQNEDFCMRFVRAYYDLCNENYRSDVVLPRLSELKTAYTDSMIETYKRFSYGSSTGGWPGGGFDWNNPGGGFDWNNPGGGFDWGQQGQDPNQQGGFDWNQQGQDPNQQGGFGWNQQGQDPNQQGAFDWSQQGGFGWNQQPAEQAPGDPNQPGQQGQQPGQQGQQTDYASAFNNEMNTINTFWQSRAENARQQVKNALGNQISGENMTVSVKSAGSKGDIKFNTLTLSKDWSGTYPQNTVLKLKAKPADGYHFVSWKISGGEFTNSTTDTSSTAYLTANGTNVSIEAVYEVGDEPEETDTKQQTTTTTKNNPSSGNLVLGDVNEDKTIDVSDAVLLARLIAEDSTAKISEQGLKNADVDKNGAPGSEDVIAILKFISKLISSF